MRKKDWQGSYIDDEQRECTSTYHYDLADPMDTLTDEDFELVRSAVFEWSHKDRVPCKVTKTQLGFSVELHHFDETGDFKGRRLKTFLELGIFREKKWDGKRSLGAFSRLFQALRSI